MTRKRETRVGPCSTLCAMTPDMERALRTAGRKAQEWTAERDRLIREARSQGGTLREIAELVGLTHTAVKLIETRATR